MTSPRSLICNLFHANNYQIQFVQCDNQLDNETFLKLYQLVNTLFFIKNSLIWEQWGSNRHINKNKIRTIWCLGNQIINKLNAKYYLLTNWNTEDTVLLKLHKKEQTRLTLPNWRYNWFSAIKIMAKTNTIRRQVAAKNKNLGLSKVLLVLNKKKCIWTIPCSYCSIST